MDQKLGFSENAIVVLKRRYLRKDNKGRIVENPKQMLERVAKAVASVEQKYGVSREEARDVENVFFQVMKNLEFMPNSPTLMNAGKELGQLSACFVVPVEDSMESIFDAIKSTALIHKTGGGTGFSFSRLRPQSSVVKTTGGVASGPVSFMKVFDSATQAVKQGGTRRGANMGILRVDHPDILSFIECKANDGDISNFNISVAITDDFIEKVLAGQKYDLINPKNKKVVGSLDAAEVFNRIAECAYNNGEPGIVFIDKINKDNPTPNLGEVESTNPCVSADTFVSTEKGLMRIKDIAKKYPKGGLKIFVDQSVLDLQYGGLDDNVAVETKRKCSLYAISRAFKTGVRNTYRITTDSGYQLIATPDHKIMTNRGWVEVKDLKINKDIIFVQPQAGVFNSDYRLPFKVENTYKGENGIIYKTNLPNCWSKELSQVLGYLIGDGWLREGDKDCRIGLTFGKNDKELLFYFKSVMNNFYGKSIQEIKRANKVWHLSYHSKYFVDFFKKLGVEPQLSDKKKIPNSIFTAPKEIVIGFLQGLFSADGTVRDNSKSNSSWVALSSKSKRLLLDTQLLLLQLNIRSKIFDRSRPLRKGMFPYIDKNGKLKSYQCDGRLYELGIFGASREKFRKFVGFLNRSKIEKLDNVQFKNFRKERFIEKIKEVKFTGKKEVFDLTEPFSHSMINNGLIVHQCGEQPLLPYESCNLGSINLYKMLKKDGQGFKVDWEKLKNIVGISVRFLDNVIDANKFPLPQITENTRKTRKVGLGIMGWATMLGFLEIPYDSKEAIDLAKKLMSFIQKEAQKVSVGLAKKKGEFPTWEGSRWQKEGVRIRNATLTTIAPTGTISIISGPTSSGIEPNFFLSYFRNVLDGEKLLEVDPAFEYYAKKKGFYSKELMKKIASGMSIQKIDEVPDEAKRIFKTAMDISSFWHIKMQAAFQEYTDNAVSKTINLASSAELDDVKESYLLAYKLNCKGLTVYRDGSRSGQVLTINKKDEKGEKKEPGQKKEGFVPYPKPRPEVILGTTTKVTTGCGNLYITLNQDENGHFFEVFTQMGKAGGCAASQLEAVGRLVSLALRGGIDIKVIVEQLKGIRCPSPSWDKGKKIFSCSDAISRVLEKRAVDQKRKTEDEKKEADLPSQEASLVESGKSSESVKKEIKSAGVSHNVVGVCPDCGFALRHQEGCLLCDACGYSKC
ncbi:MAG: TSCPD domain-containing protein [Candidatus Omnitrophica bacterium]|nr:TSCPD domain-containing protein [Candidatus Omnitrophota bacterium]MCF7876750.1 TSCPD domain-containing protein [Candidatus Omnitrophota bacterium]MCF7878210.1 TSCPD domain-containing protein [Candidatus Omnitrophota bacterium]MCF7892666.1 TSCPD domain-containing protein [Candidatus Omnitrophota bacterium]